LEQLTLKLNVKNVLLVTTQTQPVPFNALHVLQTLIQINLHLLPANLALLTNTVSLVHQSVSSEDVAKHLTFPSTVGSTQTVKMAEGGRTTLGFIHWLATALLESVCHQTLKRVAQDVTLADLECIEIQLESASSVLMAVFLMEGTQLHAQHV